MRIPPTRPPATPRHPAPLPLPRPSRLRFCGVALALSTTVAALAGCGGVSHAALRVGAAAAATPSPSESVPGADQLQAALLAPDDLGASFATEPSDTTSPSVGVGGTGQSTGCSRLDNLIDTTPQSGSGGGSPSATPSAAPRGTSPGAGQGSDAQVLLNGGQVGPFVGEYLSARPSAVLDRKYGKAASALSSCKTLDLSAGSTTVDFTLSPIDFGSPGSVARRMDGVVQGVNVNGYFVLDRLNSQVAMVYLFIQVGGTSSQAAYAYYQIAVSKAQDMLGITTSAAASV